MQFEKGEVHLKNIHMLRLEIEKDIDVCNNFSKREGSKKLYDEMIAKYSVIDENFSKNLPTNGKTASLGQAFDYTPELKAVASKLKMMLAVDDAECNYTDNPIKLKAIELLDRGKKIAVEEYCPAENGHGIPRVRGPLFNAWMSEVNIFNERNLKGHPLHDSIFSTFFHRNNKPSACSEMIGFFEALVNDNEFWGEPLNTYEISIKKQEKQSMSNKVFIVHGHDNAATESMARFLEKAGFEAIILHEQADGGMTIIEKIEKYTDVAFAVVLYTECDVGRAKEKTEEENRSRARQNVVFEHGYLIGKLGRSRVCALVKGDVETPGDISGVVYVTMDEAGAWKIQLCKNMKVAGLEFDYSKIV